jgi:hypothetical protein
MTKLERDLEWADTYGHANGLKQASEFLMRHAVYYWSNNKLEIAELLKDYSEQLKIDADNSYKAAQMITDEGKK